MSAAPAASPVDKRVTTRKSALIPSATPTIVDDSSSRTGGDDNESINEREGRELYPGPDEQKTNPYLVEFSPDDKENPKVRFFFPKIMTSELMCYRIGHDYTDGI